jgi:phosphoadenosine phosphosulfate reductase
MSDLFPHLIPAREQVLAMSPQERLDRAIDLIRMHEPEEGYYLAFSGGKDSTAVKHLARMAGVKYEAWYNNTTIDAPELIRFIKQKHPDVKWSMPKMNMMARVATAPKVPPTRLVRWCCSEYKEANGDGRTKIMGVRAAESSGRAKNYRELALDLRENVTICPIVYWSDEQLWGFIKGESIDYCMLYDEGFKRLGCVGCPLATVENQTMEFDRWPNYERNWKRAIIANWEKWNGVPRERDGKPRYQTKFRTGEDFWQWWRTTRAPDYFREECMSGELWSVAEEDKPLSGK